MTEQSTDTNLTPEQERARAEQAAARNLVRMQHEEGARFEAERRNQNMGRLSDNAFRKHVIEQYGFDPGV